MVYQQPTFHFHAYQPGDMIALHQEDSVWEPPRYIERKSPVVVTVRDKTFIASNWTRAMLSGYQHLNDLFESLFEVNGTAVASVDIEPWSMTELAKMDAENGTHIFRNVIQLFEDNKMDFVITVPFHPIMPLVHDEEKKILARVAFELALPIIRERCKKGHFELGIWLPECGYDETSIEVMLDAFDDLKEENKISQKVKLYLLLDNLQGNESLNPGSLYEMTIGGHKLPILYRDHSFSDLVAFSSSKTAFELACEVTYKEDAIKNKEKISHTLFASMDLESLLYDANYAQRFIDIVTYLHDWKRTVISPAQFIFSKNAENSFPGEPFKTLPRDHSSWSDYFSPTTLARWTGLYNDQTFWRHFEDTEVCQIWKTGYLKQQELTVNIVREKVYDLLSRFMNAKEISTFLANYAFIFFKQYFEALGQKTDLNDILPASLKRNDQSLEVLGLCGRAYYFCLASLRSCPTFWENIDTRVMQANIFHASGSLAFLLQAHDILHLDESAHELMEFFEQHYLKFSNNFYRYNLDKYSCTEHDWKMSVRLEGSPVKGCIVERTARTMLHHIPKKYLNEVALEEKSSDSFSTAHINSERRLFKNREFCEHQG